MTVRWMRTYEAAKHRQPNMTTVRLAYETYLTLFVRHERALRVHERAHERSLTPPAQKQRRVA
jgi:hypothetical protein